MTEREENRLLIIECECPERGCQWKMRRIVRCAESSILAIRREALQQHNEMAHPSGSIIAVCYPGDSRWMLPPRVTLWDWRAVV